MARTNREASGIDRRRFLKRGLAGGGLLIVAGALPFAIRSTRRWPPHAPLRLLSPDEYAVFAAAAARLVPGDGAGPRWPSADALDCAGKVDALMATVHPEIGKDFRRLLRLFESGLLGAVIAGSPRPFTRARAADQDARLEAWRRSRFGLLRSGYQAMKRLADATYYSSPEVYALVGYPGPPVVPNLPPPNSPPPTLPTPSVPR
ncbi:MAG TPA: gluconate 2-dehydrogenase subunit 3 family protein [Polyangia bacterium]|nr:gluconate 2-dehydrogenase subunit 3 family protein [Polyangia bacterium]